MRYINGIFRIFLLLFFALSVGACYGSKGMKDGSEETMPEDFGNWMVAWQYIWPELQCSQPNAVDYGNLNIPYRRTCSTGKVQSGYIYDSATSLQITQEIVSNGTQLECHNGLWMRSGLYPIPSGYTLIYIGPQPANRDASGNVTSFLPFTDYSNNDTLVCFDTNAYQYQVIKIQ